MNTFKIKSLLTNAYEDYKKYWKIFLLVTLVIAFAAVLGGTGSSFNEATQTLDQDAFAIIISGFATTWLGIGYINFLLNIVDGKQAQFKDIFYGVKSAEQFAYYVLVSLVYSVLVFFGFIFLIIPGIIISIGLMFARFYIAENRLGFEDAFRSSWQITKGSKWRIFLLGFVLLFLNILGFLALGVGLIITIPVTHLVYARLFRELEGIPLPEGGSDVEAELSDKEVVEALVA